MNLKEKINGLLEHKDSQIKPIKTEIKKLKKDIKYIQKEYNKSILKELKSELPIYVYSIETDDIYRSWTKIKKYNENTKTFTIISIIDKEGVYQKYIQYVYLKDIIRDLHNEECRLSNEVEFKTAIIKIIK